MHKAYILLNYNLDPVPRYLLLRDVLKLDSVSEDLVAAKKMVLQTKGVNDIIQLQWENGSWGQFHSMSQFSQSPITTEQAMRRFLILGLDKRDEAIQKVLTYMEKYLLRELELRDSREKNHDFDMLTRLFVATWILRFDAAILKGGLKLLVMHFHEMNITIIIIKKPIMRLINHQKINACGALRTFIWCLYCQECCQGMLKLSFWST
ncbi:hypothetical protein [Clostridium thermarum]|uniref:hypothetical protein n=1 Tax=Clostridium thermarum TaxID=1716543 RepID=UPI001120AD94|nr:hypothetical protein [Clostridium thermarum]